MRSITPSPGGTWARWHLAVREPTPQRPLCLALVNTCQWRRAATPGDTLGTYRDLAAFAVDAGVFADASARALCERAALQPHAAQHELALTRDLREALHRVLTARISGIAPRPADVALMTSSFDAVLRVLTYELRDEGLVPVARGTDVGFELPRLQCALSALALLCGPHAGKVKECADDRGCGRLFVDLTRNGSRRYCLSGQCGNRARQATFRARRRHAAHARA